MSYLVSAIIIIALWIGAYALYLFISNQSRHLEADVRELAEQFEKDT